jgi:GNAT superfamily N-acetyltransferase
MGDAETGTVAARDHAAAVETLTLAFADDPLMAWVFEDADARPALLRRWWAWIIENRQPHVDLLETGDDRSAALWHGPDPVEEPRSTSFFDLVTELLGPDVAMVKLQGLRVIPESHPAGRHWYLAAVGTRPAFQGAGSAPRVLRPVLEACDAEGLPAYLESSNPRNVSFYERFGFVATGTIQVPGGPALTPMWRDPRSRP